MAGGAGASVSTNDVWLTSDGQGAVWTQRTSFPTVATAFAMSGIVALFDASVSQPYSTIILMPGTSNGYIWSSTDLATTWNHVALAPWPYSEVRTRVELTADAENFLYALGGYEDGAVYFSWNKGVLWTALQQAALPSVWPNYAEYAISQNMCQFMLYVAGPASVPALTHKQRMRVDVGVLQPQAERVALIAQRTSSSIALTLFKEFWLAWSAYCTRRSSPTVATRSRDEGECSLATARMRTIREADSVQSDRLEIS